MSDGRQRLSNPPGFSVTELLVVIAIFGVLAAVGLAVGSTAVRGSSFSGLGRALSYQIGLAKMRAAATFTRTRVFMDLAGGTHRVQVWDKATSQWVTEGATERLPAGTAFGFGTADTAPPNTQSTIQQPFVRDGEPPLSFACYEGFDATTPAIDDSSCLLFNSRGVPVDPQGIPTGEGAIYVTDTTAVYAATVSTSGLVQLWWTPTASVAWQRQ